MEESITQISLVLCTSVILLVLGCGLRVALNRRDRLAALVLSLTLAHECVLVIFPVWYSVITNFRLEKQMLNNVTPGALAVVMIGETLYAGLFMIGLLYGANRKHQALRQSRPLGRPDTATLAVMVMIGLWTSVDVLTTPIASIAQSIAHAEVRSYSTTLEMLRNWCMSSFYLPSLFAAWVLLLVRRVWLPLRVAAAVLLASIVLFGLLSGVRGRITWVLLAGLSLAGLFGRKKALVAVGICILAVLPLFAALGDERYRFALNARLGGGGLSQKSVLPLLLDHLSSTVALAPRPVVEALMNRAMGPRNSVALFQFYDHGEGASYRAVLSSICFPIPRVFWEGKPPSGSADETPYGGAMYRVMAYSHGSQYYVMGPFLASAHAYWEGGWPWLLLTALATGAIWRLILRCCSAQPLSFGALFALVFAGAFLLDGLYTAFAPTYALIRAFWLYGVPLFCLRWIVTTISGLRSTGNLLSLSSPHVPSLSAVPTKHRF